MMPARHRGCTRHRNMRGAAVGHDLVKVVEPVLVDHARVGVLGAFDEFELASRSVTGSFSAMAPWSPVVNGSDS